MNFEIRQAFNHVVLVNDHEIGSDQTGEPPQESAGFSRINYHNILVNEKETPGGVCKNVHSYIVNDETNGFKKGKNGGKVTLVRAAKSATDKEPFPWFIRVQLFDGVKNYPTSTDSYRQNSSGTCIGTNSDRVQIYNREIRGLTFMLPVDLEVGKKLELHYEIPLNQLYDLVFSYTQEVPGVGQFDSDKYIVESMPADPLMDGGASQQRTDNAKGTVNIDLTIDSWAVVTLGTLKELNVQLQAEANDFSIPGITIENADADFTKALVWVKRHYPDLFPSDGLTIEMVSPETIPEAYGATRFTTGNILVAKGESIGQHVNTLVHELLHSRVSGGQRYVAILNDFLLGDKREHKFINAFGNAVEAHYRGTLGDPNFKANQLLGSDTGAPYVDGNFAAIYNTIDMVGLPDKYTVQSVRWQSVR